MANDDVTDSETIVATENVADGIAEQTDAASPLAAILALREDIVDTLKGEAALARLVAQIVTTALKRIAIWGVAALLFAFVGLLTLAVGLLIALAQSTGAWAAALIVTGVWMGIAGFAIWRALRAARTLKQATDVLLG